MTNHWVTKPEKRSPVQPPLAVVLAICVPLAVFGFLCLSGALFALFGSWHVLAVGFMGVGVLWPVADRVWDRVSTWSRVRLVTMLALYWSLSILVFAIGFMLLPVPLRVD